MHLARGLQHICDIKELCAQVGNDYLLRLCDSLNSCQYIHNKILQEINEQPPVSVQKGHVIRAGINPLLDELRNISSGGKEFLVTLQQREIEATGISTLKIGFNNVFGYFPGSYQFTETKSTGTVDPQTDPRQCRTFYNT
jgi:DNA mismatch repair protein MutS